jgi:rhodanese-related sulfurtransferase
MMPTLIRKLHDKDVVVFHCALSQERGPRAALQYLRQKEQETGSDAANDESHETREGTDVEGQREERKTATRQRIYVLDRGFNGWQRVYGRDEGLTEGYRPEIWEEV